MRPALDIYSIPRTADVRRSALRAKRLKQRRQIVAGLLEGQAPQHLGADDLLHALTRRRSRSRRHRRSQRREARHQLAHRSCSSIAFPPCQGVHRRTRYVERLKALPTLSARVGAELVLDNLSYTPS